jgi:hypothetical protein
MNGKIFGGLGAGPNNDDTRSIRDDCSRRSERKMMTRSRSRSSGSRKWGSKNREIGG